MLLLCCFCCLFRCCCVVALPLLLMLLCCCCVAVSLLFFCLFRTHCCGNSWLEVTPALPPHDAVSDRLCCLGARQQRGYTETNLLHGNQSAAHEYRAHAQIMLLMHIMLMNIDHAHAFHVHAQSNIRISIMS